MTLVEIAIVILVIAILMGVVGSMISSIAFLKTSKDEATLLKDSLIFSKRAAIKSNQVVYFEINLDEDYYRAYRMDRSEGEVKEVDMLTKHSPGGFNSLVAVSPPAGARITSGKLTIPFTPEGLAADMAIYIGPKPEIRATVLYSRYGNEVKVVNGEAEHNLEMPGWKEDLESW